MTPPFSESEYSVGRIGVTIFVPQPQQQLWQEVLNRREM
jgi:hypothetical protein